MKRMTTAQPEFAICIANEGYEDLQVWKVYRLLPDPKAAEVGCLRVLDESGEDYLYPASRAWRNHLFGLVCTPHDMVWQSGHPWEQEE